MSNAKTMQLSYVQDPLLGGFVVAREAAEPMSSAVPETMDDAIDAEFSVVATNADSTSAPDTAPATLEGPARPTRWLKSLPGYLQRPRPVDPIRERERQVVLSELEQSRQEMRAELENRMRSLHETARAHMASKTNDSTDPENHQEPPLYVQHYER